MLLQVHNERRQLFSAQPDGGAGLLETAPLLGSSAAGGQHSSSSSGPGSSGGPGSSSSRPTAAGLFGQQQPGGGGGGMLMQQQYAPQVGMCILWGGDGVKGQRGGRDAAAFLRAPGWPVHFWWDVGERGGQGGL